MKLCKDCIHYVGHNTCGYKRDPVTGEPAEFESNARDQREEGFSVFAILCNKCGKDARWFKPKVVAPPTSFLQALKDLVKK